VRGIDFYARRLDGWVVCKPLGIGGQGSVYHACSRQDSKLKVAVKILWKNKKTSNSDTAIENFIREASIGRSFGVHPHLMQVHGYGYMEDGAFMITQFVEGIPFYDMLASYPHGLPPEYAFIMRLM